MPAPDAVFVKRRFSVPPKERTPWPCATPCERVRRNQLSAAECR